eukprot:m.10663 g.10663  ORF g.10663 m.10663 type:complete len:502 (+) comp22536_c0_seq2:45-1550(+)
MDEDSVHLAEVNDLSTSLVSRRRQSTRTSSMGDIQQSGSGFVAIELPSPGSAAFSAMPTGRSTEEALEKCKKEVLGPYRVFLRMLGWQPWRYSGSGVLTSGKERGYKVLNCLYPIFVTCVLVVGYLTQFGACYSRDHPMYNVQNESVRVKHFCNETSENSRKNNFTFVSAFCEHAISKYLISDMIHFIGFLYGMYIFRWKENEELEILMQKTFLQTGDNNLLGYLSQKKLSTAIQAILYSGISWILFNFIASVLGLFGRLVDCTWTEPWRLGFVSWMNVETQEVMWILIIFMWVGFLAFDLVNIAVTVNYTTQCELIIVLIRGLNQKVREKTTNLQSAIKEFHNAGKAVDALNEQMAIVVSIMEFNFASHAILSLHSFFVLKDEFARLSTSDAEVLFIFSAVMDFILWASIAVFPFIQAARVSNACHSPIKVALEIATRPFQYMDTDQAELDSFITFLSAQDKKAKLFRVPIFSFMLWGIAAAALFVVLLLIELETIHFNW